MRTACVVSMVPQKLEQSFGLALSNLWIPIIYSGCTQKNVKNVDEPISTTIPNMRFWWFSNDFQTRPQSKGGVPKSAVRSMLSGCNERATV